jgi:hypothetical protein
MGCMVFEKPINMTISLKFDVSAKTTVIVLSSVTK